MSTIGWVGGECIGAAIGRRHDHQPNFPTLFTKTEKPCQAPISTHPLSRNWMKAVKRNWCSGLNRRPLDPRSRAPSTTLPIFASRSVWPKQTPVPWALRKKPACPTACIDSWIPISILLICKCMEMWLSANLNAMQDPTISRTINDYRPSVYFVDSVYCIVLYCICDFLFQWIAAVGFGYNHGDCLVMHWLSSNVHGSSILVLSTVLHHKATTSLYYMLFQEIN